MSELEVLIVVDIVVDVTLYELDVAVINPEVVDTLENEDP